MQRTMRPSFKIIVIGDPFVGKTCLTFRFCDNKFVSTENTIGVDIRQKVVVLDDEPIQLLVWDTAGMEQFRQSMLQHYYRHVDAIILVYDMTKIDSFNNLLHWVNECKKSGIDTEKVPIVLVGNKCDLHDRIAVSHQTALRFADGLGIPLFETSAYSDNHYDNVNAIFMTLAYKLKNSKPFSLPHKKDVTTVGKSNEISESGGCC